MFIKAAIRPFPAYSRLISLDPREFPDSSVLQNLYGKSLRSLRNKVAQYQIQGGNSQDAKDET